MRKKLSEVVSNGILEMLRKKHLAPGDRLPTEGDLAELFDVSRTAVREGVKSLVAMGFLEIRRGIGTFVVDTQLGPLRDPLSNTSSGQLSQLFELLEFRQIIEPASAALAAQRRTEDELAELERCVKELARGIQLRIKLPEDIGFHIALAHATHNSAIIDATNLIFRFYQGDPNLPDQSDLDGHSGVYEAVRDQDPDRARQAMLIHFVTLHKRYTSS